MLCMNFPPTKGAMAHGSALFGEGLGSIFLDDVSCTGSEVALLSCPSELIGIHDCGHYEDAGVACARKLHSFMDAYMTQDAQLNDL